MFIRAESLTRTRTSCISRFIGKMVYETKSFEEAIDLYLQAEKIAELHPTKTLLTDLCICYEKINDSEMFQSFSNKYFWLSYNKDK
jgi:hypothetical protein